jgi:hypothetical protein
MFWEIVAALLFVFVGLPLAVAALMNLPFLLAALYATVMVAWDWLVAKVSK